MMENALSNLAGSVTHRSTGFVTLLPTSSLGSPLVNLHPYFQPAPVRNTKFRESIDHSKGAHHARFPLRALRTMQQRSTCHRLPINFSFFFYLSEISYTQDTGFIATIIPDSQFRLLITTTLSRFFLSRCRAIRRQQIIPTRNSL